MAAKDLKFVGVRPIYWADRDKYEEDTDGKLKLVCEKCHRQFFASKKRSVCSVECLRR